MLTESQRREIYHWLEKTDPSPIHNRNWKLHEKETSSWILRSPDWNKWLAGDVRCLWIHGIPGAGKTILTSFLVEELKVHCKHQKGSGYCYYYCYFGHNQDETFPFLTWIIAQLCRQMEYVPDFVFELYRRGGEPNLTELILALELSLRDFDMAYVILDAADESKPREDLLRVLRQLATDARFSKIRCICTSRKYGDIEQSLEPISHSIPMSNDLVADDIRKYVHSILHSTPKFLRWPEDLRMEVEEALVDGSKGMFRWAVCQLDWLQRLKCERQIIRKALSSLPKTLDETYERIFKEIPKDDWPFARHVLQWICFHQNMYKDHHPMSLKILLAAAELSTCEEFHQENDFEFDAERLRDMLGCLICVDEDFVFLAHYTVKEYLQSQRTSKSATSYFWTGQQTKIKECMRTILQQAQAIDWPGENYVLLAGNGVGDTPDAFIQDFAVYCAVSSSMLLLTRPNVVASDKLLLPLAVDFVNPSLNHFNDIVWIHDNFQDTSCFFSEQNRDMVGYYRLPSWNHQPDCIEAGILLYFLLQSANSPIPILAGAFLEDKEVKDIAQTHVSFTLELYELDEHWFPDGYYEFDGSLLEVMAQLSGICTPFTWLLDQCDAMVDTGHLLAAVGFHTHFHDEAPKDQCALKKILSGQADPNAAGYLVTPLQIAVAMSDIEGVRELLEAGADSNATGDLNGTPFKTSSILESLNELHGMSPLHICKNFEPQEVNRNSDGALEHQTVEFVKPAIEALLLQHGARDFSLFIS